MHLQSNYYTDHDVRRLRRDTTNQIETMRECGTIGMRELQRFSGIDHERPCDSMKLSFGYSRISESIDLTFRRQSAYFNDVFENAEACLEKNSREPSDMRFAKPEEVLVA